MNTDTSAQQGDVLGRVAQIDRSTLAEEIYRRLRRAVLSGELVSGERIQPDRLATVIGVSRTPVREALQRLLSEGYLEQEARHAFRVAPVDYKSGRELFAIRSVLEGLAAREAAENIDQEHRDEIQRTIDAITQNEAAEWPERAVGEFHRIVYRASGNRHLGLLLDRVFEQTLRYRFLTRSDTTDRQAETLESHTKILQALVDGRGEDAENLMREHVMVLARRFQTLEAANAE